VAVAVIVLSVDFIVVVGIVELVATVPACNAYVVFYLLKAIHRE